LGTGTAQSIVTELRDGRQQFDSRKGQGSFFLFVITSRPALESNLTSYQVDTDFSVGDKAAGTWS